MPSSALSTDAHLHVGLQFGFLYLSPRSWLFLLPGSLFSFTQVWMVRFETVATWAWSSTWIRFEVFFDSSTIPTILGQFSSCGHLQGVDFSPMGPKLDNTGHSGPRNINTLQDLWYIIWRMSILLATSVIYTRWYRHFTCYHTTNDA